jgi:hypothetical protein
MERKLAQIGVSRTDASESTLNFWKAGGRAMDIFVAALLAAQQAIFGVLAVLVSLEQNRKRYAVGFAALAIAGIGLTIWQAFLAQQSGDAAIKTQLGDAGHPPHIAVISLPNETFFVRTNTSEYPAYSVQIHLYSEKDQTRPMRSYGPEELAANTAVMDNDPWTGNDNLEHRFMAEIVSRTGIAHEELILRPAGNNQWMMACRTDGKISKCQQPDSAWPRDANGQPDWN